MTSKYSRIPSGMHTKSLGSHIFLLFFIFLPLVMASQNNNKQKGTIMILEFTNEHTGSTEYRDITETGNQVVSLYALYTSRGYVYVDVLLEDGTQMTLKSSACPDWRAETKVIKGGFLQIPRLRKESDVIKVPLMEDFAFYIQSEPSRYETPRTYERIASALERAAGATVVAEPNPFGTFYDPWC